MEFSIYNLKYFGVSNNTFFVNENDGIVNANALGTNQWSNLNFTNKGLFNKVSNTITRFNNNFGTGTFINDVGVTLSIAAGQEIQFLNTATLNGTISNSGILSFNALCTLNGSLINKAGILPQLLYQFRVFYFWEWNIKCKQFIAIPYDLHLLFLP
ncbi:MAG: hypothetical protein IPN72_15075 [Saprospiraceae bacterium]|nr:hypothetical protein [Saprospiraceae bacterium]